jgi:CheY-like chemotaxis protein
VQSTQGGGSVFTVILPIGVANERSERDTEHRRIQVPGIGTADDHTGKSEHLLLIDDNETVLNQLKEVLERDGYRLSLVASGELAMDQLIALKPDGVLLDLMIPDKSGFDILEEMRQHPLFKATPVLVITAKTLSAAESRDLTNASVRQVLTKGLFDEKDLLQAIYSMFEG